MGCVHSKTVMKPLPSGADIFVRKGERFAYWRDAKRKIRTAELTKSKDGADRIVITATHSWRNVLLLDRADALGEYLVLELVRRKGG